MSDDKPKWDTPEHVKSAAPHEAGDLARAHGISVDRAQMLVDRFGHDPERLRSEAEKIAQPRHSEARGA